MNLSLIREALEKAWAAIGDAQLSGKGISTGYAHAVQREIREALKELGEAEGVCTGNACWQDSDSDVHHVPPCALSLGGGDLVEGLGRLREFLVKLGREAEPEWIGHGAMKRLAWLDSHYMELRCAAPSGEAEELAREIETSMEPSFAPGMFVSKVGPEKLDAWAARVRALGAPGPRLSEEPACSECGGSEVVARRADPPLYRKLVACPACVGTPAKAEEGRDDG